MIVEIVQWIYHAAPIVREVMKPLPKNAQSGRKNVLCAGIVKKMMLIALRHDLPFHNETQGWEISIGSQHQEIVYRWLSWINRCSTSIQVPNHKAADHTEHQPVLPSSQPADTYAEVLSGKEFRRPKRNLSCHQLLPLRSLLHLYVYTVPNNTSASGKSCSMLYRDLIILLRSTPQYNARPLSTIALSLM